MNDISGKDLAKNWFWIVLAAAVFLFTACSKSSVLSPSAFTHEYAEFLQKQAAHLTVQIVGELELHFVDGNGKDAGSQFLSNAYDVYKEAPEHKIKVMERYAADWLSAAATIDKPVDKTMIVPVVKDRGWLEEVKKAASRQKSNTTETIYEELNPDLIVAYAEDSPNTIRFLTPELLETAKVNREELRKLACDNLRRLLPEIKYEGGKGFYVIMVGGDYEASLLLLDSVWTDKQIDVNGEIVVGIPARKYLLVGDTSNPTALQKLRDLVKQVYSEGSYRLTPKLFVRRNGNWVEYHPR